MFVKLFLILAIIAGFACGESAKNWNGYLDTIQMPPCSSTVLIYSNKCMTLTDFDMLRIIAQANDTSSAGFKSDSVNFIWGYQTFSLCLDSNNNPDTCYSPRVLVDTFRTALFGTMTVLTLDANAIAASPTKNIDTLSCGGWAIQSRTFAPEWDTLYRIWVQGLTGNKATKRIKLLFTCTRRIFSPISGR
jgi:hypothetical protein